MLFTLCNGRLPLTPRADADSQRLVSVYADGQKRVFATASGTVADVLDRAGIKLGPNDLVEPPENTDVTKSFFNINVYRARPVTIQDGDQTYRILSAYQNPRVLAEEAGLTIYNEDLFKSEIISNIVSEGAVGVKITVIRSIPIEVRADGKTHYIRTQEKTVGDALKAAGISLGLQDAVQPGVDSAVSPSIKIRIIRVATAETVESETLRFSTRTVEDSSIAWGQKSVKQAGNNGYKKVSYRLHYRDGVVVSKELLKVVERVEPIERIETIGTKVMFYGSSERAGLMSQAGIGSSDYGYVDYIISKESGWVVNSWNHTSSGAYGLGQALPASKMAAFGADYMTNPVTQLRWASSYAVSRYGSWSAAHTFWRANGWW